MWIVTVYQIPSMCDIISYECYSRQHLIELEHHLKETLDFNKHDYEFYRAF